MVNLKKETQKSPELKGSGTEVFKFIILISSILIFVFLVLGIFLIQTQSSLFKNEIEARAKLITELISKRAETPIVFDNLEELESIVKDSLESYKGFLEYAVIFDEEKKPLTLTSKKPKYIDPKKILTISTVIGKGDGYVEAGYSLLFLEKFRKNLILEILIAIFFSGLFSALGIILISRKLIIQPASEVAKINLKLRELTEELEQKVKERTAELERERASLEIKVRERTRELKELTEKQEEIIKERTRELREKVEELEKMKKELEERVAELEEFRKVTVGREMKMIELKQEIERLKKELEKYKMEYGTK
jgi:hypothetical protein